MVLAAVGVDRRVEHLGEVLASGEGAACAGDHDASDLVVDSGVEQRAAGGVPELVVEGVANVRSVPGEEADAVSIFDPQGHA